MIGFYNYTVILTYVGLLSGVSGIAAACMGNPVFAVFCLIFSGFCDMFDGKIARTRKKSTEPEKRFGIQIDSLCDIICFCMLPATIGFVIADGKIWMIVICAALVLCGLIRLAYFNVIEEERQSKEGGRRIYFEGMPVTSSALVVPFVFCFEPLFRERGILEIQQFSGLTTVGFAVMMTAFIGVMGLCYILPIKVRKPYKVGTVVICVLGLAIVSVLVCNYIVKIF